MRKLLLGTFIILFGFILSGFTATEDKPIRIFISADMEGIAGAIEPNQIIDGGMEYQKFREIMTNEVLAAIDGARAGGATEFVVADAHGGMQNLLFDRFPDDVEIVRGSPRPHGMMEGIQDGHFVVPRKRGAGAGRSGLARERSDADPKGLSGWHSDGQDDHRRRRWRSRVR